MNFTEQDKRFFEQLSRTETGRYFADYVKRVIDCVYDSRNWSESDSRESARLAAKMLEDQVLNRIRPQQKNAKPDNQFE